MQKLLLLVTFAFLGTITFSQYAYNAIPDIQPAADQHTGSPEDRFQFHSLEEVLNFADANAAAIQSAILQEQISSAEKKVTRSYLLPTTAVSFGYTDNIKLQPALIPAQMFNPEAPDGSFEELTFGTKYNYSWGLQAQWDVLNFQKIFALQTAEMDVEKSRSNIELHRYNTYNSIASSYYSIILTQESIRIYEENVRLSESILELATEKYHQGIISQSELNRAEIKHLQNKMSLDQAISNLDQFYIQLQSQLNTTVPVVIMDTPENFVLDNTVIDTKHPEILWQEAEVRRYQAFLKQEKAGRLPTLSLFYQNNRNWATENIVDFSNVYELPQQYFGVTMSIPLTGFSTSQKISQSKLMLQLQQEQLENTKLVKKNEDLLLHLQVKQAKDLLTNNKEILTLQEQNDVHTENKYQNEVISLDERLDRYDDLLAAQNSYLQSLAEYTLANYKIYIRQIDFN